MHSNTTMIGYQLISSEQEKAVKEMPSPGTQQTVLRMFLLQSRLVFLPILLGVVYAAPTLDGGGKRHPEEIVLSFPKDEASLSEMFREVEELMEDTQYKLRNAVEEVRLAFQTRALGFRRDLGIVGKSSTFNHRLG
ncbi:UNVERIFIED_CONTAM: hypothetical protein K2H54_058583 [Gekko kuhli]